MKLLVLAIWMAGGAIVALFAWDEMGWVGVAVTTYGMLWFGLVLLWIIHEDVEYVRRLTNPRLHRREDARLDPVGGTAVSR